MASMMDAATAVKKGAPFCHVYDFDATSACLLWSTIAKAPCYTYLGREPSAWRFRAVR